MSKILHVKMWSMLLAAALLSTGTAFAAETTANEEAPQTANATTGTCTGEVIDELGEPVMGAAVKVEGANLSASTDLDGKFTIPGVKIGATIQISFVGYNTQTVKWTGAPLAITLSEGSTKLDEVVVMGYGIQQKRANVTNSIAKVSEQTLTVGANANPAQALAGAVAGVKVNVTSGDPSATPSIVIRGGTNFDGTGAPVIVVDGQIRSSMSDINPNDIGDMQILKDAGATALYGARAANGVILITTKQGKSGTSQINFNVKYGMNWYNDTGYDWLTAEEYLTWYRRAIYNSPWAPTNILFNANTAGYGAAAGSTTVTGSSYWNVMTLDDSNKHYVDQYGWQTMKDVVPDADGNYRTLLFKETSPLRYNLTTPSHTQDYNVSFSGGNDKGNYYASIGYYDAGGAFEGTYYKRYNFALTGTYQLASWLKSSSTFNYVRANWCNQVANAANITPTGFFGRTMSMPPTVRLEDEEGNPLYGNNGINLKFQPEKFERDNQSDKFQMTQSLTATIIDGLTVKGTMSWYYNEEFDEAFNHDYVTNIWGATNNTRSTSASFGRYFDQTYNVVANFSRTFNEKHDINAMVGMEYYKRNYKFFSASGTGAPTDEFADLGLTMNGEAYLADNGNLVYKASTRSIDSEHVEEAILSYMGRAEYNYDGKYHLAATFREDGYSRLINNRWGFFPGLSAGWTFSRENFWKENPSLHFMNYGKLRTSYGMNGIVSSNVIGYYTLQGAYSAYKYDGAYGYRISALPNPDLRWEKTRTFEIGVDFGFLNDRIQFSTTYYNRLTSDKYASLALPQTTGFSSVTNNNGKYRNQGVEFDLNTTIFQNREWSVRLGANLTYNKNVIVELPDNGLENNRQGATAVYRGIGSDADDIIYIGGYQEGQEPNHLIGYKSSHMLRSQADVDAMGDYIDLQGWNGQAMYATDAGFQRLKELGRENQAQKLQPGDMVWCDRNGDNRIDNYDRYDLGLLRIPHWTGGFNTNIKYKNFTLYSRWDMGFGLNVYDSAFGWWMGCGQGGYSTTTAVYDSWTEDNPGARWPRYVYADQLGPTNYFRTSDVLFQNGAYLALRELQLSYTLPMELCKKFACKGLTVSATGQNLGYFKKCTNPLPDNNLGSDAATAGGVGTYNLPRTLLFGLNVSF